MSEHGSGRVIGYNNGCPAVWETRGPDEASFKAIDGYLGGVRLNRSGRWDAIWNGPRHGFNRRSFQTREEAEARVEAEAWRMGRLYPRPSPWHDYDDRQSVILIPGDTWKVADVTQALDGTWSAVCRCRSPRSTTWAHWTQGHPTREAAKAAAEAWLKAKRVVW